MRLISPRSDQLPLLLMLLLLRLHLLLLWFGTVTVIFRFVVDSHKHFVIFCLK